MKLKDLFKEKGIFSGKKVLAITMVLTFVGGMTLGAAASNHTWGSTGNVVYDNNGQKTTVFNKQDLIYLDDRISTIEAGVDTGKVNIAKKLNEWELPADKIVPTTNPSFNQINTALEYIKSIPNAGKEWKDASNNSYYVKEDGSITTNASEAKKNADGNVEPLKISAATAGNLSAGTSAWVDGSLLIGTGADNKNYYEQATTPIYISSIVLSASASANSNVSNDSSVGTNKTVSSSSGSSSFSISIKGYSKLSIQSGTCSYSLKDSSGIKSNASGTITGNDAIGIYGYDLLTLSYTTSASKESIGTHNSGTSCSSSIHITGIEIK